MLRSGRSPRGARWRRGSGDGDRRGGLPLVTRGPAPVGRCYRSRTLPRRGPYGMIALDISTASATPLPPPRQSVAMPRLQRRVFSA